MRKKKIISHEPDYSYILPFDNKEQIKYIEKYKIDMMEHVVDIIELTMDQKNNIAEVFQYKNSPFIVTIPCTEFSSNLNHIFKHFLEKENYEYCKKIKVLLERINKEYQFLNEKEKTREIPESTVKPTTT